MMEQPAMYAAQPSLARSSSGQLQPTDLRYQGAFVYPVGDEWAYSGHALAYYPGGDAGGPNDGYPGSLYAAGLNPERLVGEMSIPAPVITKDFEALPRATVLQPLADITGGWRDNCTAEPGCEYVEVAGLAYLDNVDKIAWNLRDWYNAAARDQDSLGWSNRDYSGARVKMRSSIMPRPPTISSRRRWLLPINIWAGSGC
jgi:hypothetical protein